VTDTVPRRGEAQAGSHPCDPTEAGVGDRPSVSDPAPLPTPRRLTRRDSRWLLRRCGKRGHVLAYLDDPVGERFQATGPDGVLLRCQRCGVFVRPDDPATRSERIYGTLPSPARLADLPLVLRGAHGRKLALLRLLAVERGARGVLLVVAAAGLAQLASSHVAVAEWLGRVAESAKPLGDQLGWDVTRSHLLQQAESLLGSSSGTFTLVAWLVAGYGALQITEGIGLWGGWRWAEYLAAVATSLFVPLEVYELADHPTLFKAGALLVNLVAVAYLVFKGRLFGIRGGHQAYLHEVREATLLADELVRTGRGTQDLIGHHLA
jgi:uncharacterized membrane protein (DUF2068 family)